mmetsp:Transcript_11627/g.43345  ORF Transcript_11627/g.43345 Transcript_11627/m.43345 type:complete len:307 (+) Transcript_11627:2396-3316(+)
MQETPPEHRIALPHAAHEPVQVGEQKLLVQPALSQVAAQVVHRPFRLRLVAIREVGSVLHAHRVGERRARRRVALPLDAQVDDEAHEGRDAPVLAEVPVNNFSHGRRLALQQLRKEVQAHVQHGALRREARGAVLGKGKRRGLHVDVIVLHAANDLAHHVLRHAESREEVLRIALGSAARARVVPAASAQPADLLQQLRGQRRSFVPIVRHDDPLAQSAWDVSLQQQEHDAEEVERLAKQLSAGVVEKDVLDGVRDVVARLHVAQELVEVVDVRHDALEHAIHSAQELAVVIPEFQVQVQEPRGRV